MSKPNFVRPSQLPPIRVQRQERYLPSAFDDSLSYLEKLNKVIHYMNELGEITEQMMGNWNEVYRWVMNEGLDETIGGRLREWLDNGTFDRIINQNIFNELNGKIDRIIIEVNEDFKKLSDKLNKEIADLINHFNDLQYGIGTINFEWSD